MLRFGGIIYNSYLLDVENLNFIFLIFVSKICHVSTRLKGVHLKFTDDEILLSFQNVNLEPLYSSKELIFITEFLGIL